MPKTHKTTLSADEIAERATRGEDVSAYFSNKFTVVKPIHRVNVDLTLGMLRQLDEQAARLNISRQAVIKTLLDRALRENRSSKRRRTTD
ncbi:MAG TPA: hypothetical protein VKG25_21710 [Bryobacteraceae bacterium]|nr:hypothetical protein [Bryobacteraceae bacterium]